MATANKTSKLKVGAEAPLEIVTVTVSKTHYDRATKAEKSGNYYVLTQCLLAQAFKTAFPGKAISVGSDDVEVGKGAKQRSYTIDKKGQRLINQFDNDNVDRKELPITIKLTEIPASA